MKIEEFDFELDPARIAQRPVEPRDSSKLLVCEADGRLGDWRSAFTCRHASFRDLVDLLGPSDFVVLNDAKVLPVRLLGHREVASGGGGAVEALLLRRVAPLEWQAIMHLSARIRPGLKFIFEPGVTAEVLSTHEERVASEGEVRLRFGGIALNRPSAPGADARRPRALSPDDITQAERRFEAWLERHGHVPLPPYIERADTSEDKKTYQTVYAARSGSAAAPTAGFHFTPELLTKLDGRGALRSSITLHVGLGTFRPIKAERVDDHVMHEESFEIGEDFLEAFRRAKAEGRRVVAVGTTVVRALESWAQICVERGIECGNKRSAGVFSTRIFIRPGYKFQLVDDLLTNFHLPRSTLLVLVAAAMGSAAMHEAYQQALAGGYRFFSYGDAMFLRGR